MLPSAPRSRALAGALLLVWLVYTVALGLAYSRLPVNPDQAIFDYIGWRLTQGDRLYLDVAEQNFPAKMWLHAASTWLFGNHAWSYRAFDYLLLLPFCFVLRALLRPTAAGPLASIVVPLYQAMYVTAGAWMAGTRDLLGAHLLLTGTLAWRRRQLGGHAAWAFAFGLACGVTVLMRPTYVLFPALVVALDAFAWWRGRRALSAVCSDAALAAAACIAVLGGLALAGYATGQLQEWYELAVRYNMQVYSHNAGVMDCVRRLVDFAHAWHWYIACGLLGLAVAMRDPMASRFVPWAALGGLAAILSAFAQLKGFGYHFAGILPTFALGTAYLLAVSTLRLRAQPQAARWLVALALWALAIGGTLKKQHSQLHRQYAWLAGGTSARDMLAGDDYADVLGVADLVQQTVPADRSVLVWSRMLHVNFLTAHRSPTRFITVWMLAGMPAQFATGNRWLDEFERALTDDAPAVIVTDAPGQPGRGIDIWAEPQPSRAIAILRAYLQADYVRETAIGNLVVYRHRPR